MRYRAPPVKSVINFRRTRYHSLRVLIYRVYALGVGSAPATLSIACLSSPEKSGKLDVLVEPFRTPSTPWVDRDQATQAFRHSYRLWASASDLPGIHSGRWLRSSDASVLSSPEKVVAHCAGSTHKRHYYRLCALTFALPV